MTIHEEQGRAWGRLWGDWEKQYPDQLHEFSRDGILDVPTFDSQERRLLFVTAEPNLKGKEMAGVDLRCLYLEGTAHPFNQNLSRWAGALLDGQTSFEERVDDKSVTQRLKRLAVLNLKKLAGTSTARSRVIGEHAWRDRELILREIELIRPDVIVTSGASVNHTFPRLMVGDRSRLPAPLVPTDLRVSGRSWSLGNRVVIPSWHPSCRHMDWQRAFERMVEHAEWLRQRS